MITAGLDPQWVDISKCIDPNGVAQQQKCQFVCFAMCDPVGVGCLGGCHPPQVKTCGYHSATSPRSLCPLGDVGDAFVATAEKEQI